MDPADAQDTRRTVLVVDDFDDTRLLLRTWFERRGFRVIEAENGVQAISRAQTESPDLIIMDVQMPKLDARSNAADTQCEGARVRTDRRGFGVWRRTVPRPRAGCRVR